MVKDDSVLTAEEKREKQRLIDILAFKLVELERVEKVVRIISELAALLRVKTGHGVRPAEYGGKIAGLIAEGLPEFIAVPALEVANFFVEKPEYDRFLELHWLGTSVIEVEEAEKREGELELELFKLLTHESGVWLLGALDLTAVTFGGGYSLRELGGQLQKLDGVVKNVYSIWDI